MATKLPETDSSDMASRLEEAGLNGLPALRTEYYDGWIVRMSEGYSRRANCVVPLYGSTIPLPEKLAHCEAAYEQESLPCIFKMSPASQPPNLDDVLAQSQYSRDADTLVQTSVLGASKFSGSSVISLCDDPSAEWLETWRHLSDRNQHAGVLHSLLSAIIAPSAYVVARVDGKPVGCARAVASGATVGLFDLLVDPEYRGHGLGTALLEARLNWGYEQGARLAYLQVMANNSPALGLQRKYGFTESYRYWYRVQSLCESENRNC